MEPKSGRKRPIIELRYYDLPEHEPVLALQGEEWVRSYGDENEDLHFHNLMEVGLCRWGKGEMRLDDRCIPYGAGVVTLIPANCLHVTISCDGAMNEWAYLFFDPRAVLQKAFPDNPVFADALLRQLENEAHCLEAQQARAFASLIELILEEYRAENDYHAEMVQNLLVSLLVMAARLSRNKEKPLSALAPGLRQILPAVEYIGRNYMNPITVSQLAAQCSLSEAHLRRMFQAHLHMSPLENLTIVRIRRAAELLKTTNYSVSEVALRVGYQSVSSFERNFQHYTEFSPYQYKKHGRDYKGKLIKYKVSAKRGWQTRQDE